MFRAPVKEGAWSSVGPCLLDADGDGRFEAALTAAFNSGESHGLIVTDRRNLLGVLYSEPKPLAAPVAYAADYRAAPVALARIQWSVSQSRQRPDQPPRPTLQLNASDKDSGTHALSLPVTRTLIPDRTGQVTIEGVTARALGLDDKGADASLTYQNLPSRFRSNELIETTTPRAPLP